MLDFAIFAICFLSTLLVAILWLYPGSKKVTTIPGLNPTSKEDGNLSDVARAGSLHEFLVDLHGQFGPIAGFWFGQTYTVSIASPELFKQHSNVFDRPALLFKMFEPLIGAASIQYANGSDGRQRRHHYDRAFGHSRLEANFDTFQKISEEVVGKWSAKTEHDHIPLSADMFTLAIRQGLPTLMGDSFHDEKTAAKFRTAYEQAWEEMEQRLKNPTIPDPQSPRMKSFNQAVKTLHIIVQEAVEHRQSTSEQGTLLIDDILEFSSSTEVLLSDSITYLIGGTHTTANLLTWCVYFLASHQDVQNKLYKEMVEVLGKEGPLKFEDIPKLVYLRQVLDETMRCAVLAPFAGRFQEFDSELGGHRIPKNTPVIHALGTVLHDENIWPLPKKFDPERFTEENSKHRHPYAFQPFGFAGKRKCPGYKFSYLESSTFLCCALRKFKFNMHGDQVVLPVHGLVTHPADEIWLKVTKRNVDLSEV